MNAANSRQNPRHQSDDSMFEMRSTRWKNPTEHVQKVTLLDAFNQKRVVTWQPGETKDVPSEYDHGIHMVDCGQDECHRGGGARGGGWYCKKGHPGVIVGGLAPLLVRVGVEDQLDPSLDPEASAKKTAEANMIAAAMSRQAASQALVEAASMAGDAKPASPQNQGNKKA